MSLQTPLIQTVFRVWGKLVSLAAIRAKVTQRSPSPRGHGERCVTSARVAAKETRENYCLCNKAGKSHRKTERSPESKTLDCLSPFLLDEVFQT